MPNSTDECRTQTVHKHTHYTHARAFGVHLGNKKSTAKLVRGLACQWQTKGNGLGEQRELVEPKQSQELLGTIERPAEKQADRLVSKSQCE